MNWAVDTSSSYDPYEDSLYLCVAYDVCPSGPPMNADSPRFHFFKPLKLDTPTEQGLLDVVFCIDVSGSMMDDIRALQQESAKTLANLGDYASTNNISLHVGLVTYTRHDEANWLHADRLTADVASLRDSINAIKITNPGSGAGGNEDTYGAVMYAMNQTVGGNRMDMGWRTGTEKKGAAVSSQNPAATGTPINLGDRAAAAKIIITMGDEPQDDPDWMSNTLDKVATAARNLDPVHVYPIVLPKEGPAFLDRAVKAKQRLADATDGSLIKIDNPKSLPAALVDTVKLAVRRHKDEVWRKTHPPYLLYTVGAALGLLALVVIMAASLSHQRRLAAQRAATAAARARIDPTLVSGSRPDATDPGPAPRPPNTG